MTGRQELHALAIFVHGILTGLHALGIAYNVQRRNRWQTGAHLAGVIFSGHATWHHTQEMQRP